MRLKAGEEVTASEGDAFSPSSPPDASSRERREDSSSVEVPQGVSRLRVERRHPQELGSVSPTEQMYKRVTTCWCGQPPNSNPMERKNNEQRIQNQEKINISPA